MYVNPFVAGIFVTITFEIAACICVSIYATIKNNKE